MDLKCSGAKGNGPGPCKPRQTDMSSREANPLPFINMLTGLLNQSQAQAEGMAGSGGKLWGQG